MQKLAVRALAEFLCRTGSIDSRFTGFDRASEGARIHRRLQRAARREHPGYEDEVFLHRRFEAGETVFELEGRADGVFTDADGVLTVDEIKTTAVPAGSITEDLAPEHWAQAQMYAAILAAERGAGLVRVRLLYYQTDDRSLHLFCRDLSAGDLAAFTQSLLEQFLPWAQRAAGWTEKRNAGLRGLCFPYPAYRPGQHAMAGEVYRVCRGGGALFCQAPTGIGKTMSALFPALRAMGEDGTGPVFYLTARGTGRTAAEDALRLLHASSPELCLRSITLTAKDRICLCEQRECTPEHCPYANGYYARIRDALWDALGADLLTADELCGFARKHTVCPFELGLDCSLWCDVVIGDYNYLFDPAVVLRRFFDSGGDYLFLVDEAHNLPSRAREMYSARLDKSAFLAAKKLPGVGKGRLKTQLGRVNDHFLGWKHSLGDDAETSVFTESCDSAFNELLEPLSAGLKDWLTLHRGQSETRTALLGLFFGIRAWLRTADLYDTNYVFERTVRGREVSVSMLCLDPGRYIAASFSLGRAAVLFSATLAPASYYRDLCGLPEARAVALPSPFEPSHLGLFCVADVSTLYRERAGSLGRLTDCLAAMAQARPGNYLAFFPSYAYLQQAYESFTAAQPGIAAFCQSAEMGEAGRADFLARFSGEHEGSLLGFAVLGGVFGEGIDLAGEKLVGAAVVSPGLPQMNARQEQLRGYFEESRGRGFDYAYRYPGMNKVLQAAGRVIRSESDRGVVLLIGSRFASGGYRRLMPPHWAGLRTTRSGCELRRALGDFWAQAEP